MLAIIKTGGKQYLIAPGKKIRIEKVKIKEGEEIIFNEVLLTVKGESVVVGTPFVKEAKVKAKVLSHGKGDKVVVFKYKPKKRERTKKGHRQPYSEIEIMKIEI